MFGVLGLSPSNIAYDIYIYIYIFSQTINYSKIRELSEEGE